MKIYNFIFVILSLFASCSNVDRVADKSKLSPGDYRLFQETPVWELAKAANDKNMTEVKRILSDNPELANVQDSIYGNTLLMMSIINQNYDLFELLIDNGTNLNYHNTYGGQSPLIEACSYKQYDPIFVKDLVNNGANINDTTNNFPNAQLSPLMAAARCGNSAIVTYLIDHGADINYRNNFGSTPLGEAILTQKYDIALLLLNRGADYSLPIYNGLDDYGKSTVPINLLTALRNAMMEIGTPEYHKKQEIIQFLKTKDIDYYAVPIPKYVVDRAKKKYPSSWQEYLKRY